MKSTKIIPLVSVVMPVLNCENYVSMAINSILSQTFHDFEFIIVDDGSTDGTSEIISSFSDERIRFFRFEKNRGFIEALEYGIKIAKGKWIARMDGDDVCAPERLATELSYLEKFSDCIFIGTTYHHISPSGKIIEISKFPKDGYRFINKADITFSKRKFADSSVIYLREAAIEVGLLDKDIRNENPLWYKLLEKGKALEIYNALYVYRIVLASMTKKMAEDSSREVSRRVRVRYDPENARFHSSWNKFSWPDEKTKRQNNIIFAMQICHITGDLKEVFNIFSKILPEFWFDYRIFEIIIRGFFGIKSLNPFKIKKDSPYKEIHLDWYEKLIT